MLSEQAATSVVKKAFPDSDVGTPVVYQSQYLFQVTSPDPDEGAFDPFYSVDQNTGALAEFSIFTDGNVNDILDLFAERSKS